MGPLIVFIDEIIKVEIKLARQPIENNINYQLPSGEFKKMKVTNKSHKISLIQNAIELNIFLDFDSY